MSKRFRKLSPTIYECKYHLIFCSKYRQRILKDEIGEYTSARNRQSVEAERRD